MSISAPFSLQISFFSRKFQKSLLLIFLLKNSHFVKLMGNVGLKEIRRGSEGLKEIGIMRIIPCGMRHARNPTA